MRNLYKVDIIPNFKQDLVAHPLMYGYNLFGDDKHVVHAVVFRLSPVIHQENLVTYWRAREPSRAQTILIRWHSIPLLQAKATHHWRFLEAQVSDLSVKALWEVEIVCATALYSYNLFRFGDFSPSICERFRFSLYFFCIFDELGAVSFRLRWSSTTALYLTKSSLSRSWIVPLKARLSSWISRQVVRQHITTNPCPGVGGELLATSLSLPLTSHSDFPHCYQPP